MISSNRTRRACARPRPRALRALAAALAAAASVAAAPPQERPSLSGVVNVNTASAEELQLLPGIGEARARALIELRKRRGGFKTLDELKEVKGLGDASLEQLRPYVRFDGQTTAHRE
jgi:competence protein ComEA